MIFSAPHYLALYVILAAVIAVPAYADGNWPTIPMPKESTRYPVDDILVTNGVPMQITAFTSPLPQEKLLKWFRKTLDGHWVEDQFGKKTVIGQARGNYYFTVQMEPTHDGSRGIVAICDLKAAYEQREKTQAKRNHWLHQLPSGSHIISETTSENRWRRSEQQIYTNTHSAATNRDVLRDVLGRDGLLFERESRVDDTQPTSTMSPTNGRTLYFKGAHGEAIATISSDDDRHTIIVLNTIIEKGKAQ